MLWQGAAGNVYCKNLRTVFRRHPGNCKIINWRPICTCWWKNCWFSLPGLLMWILTISTHFFLFPCGRPWCSPPCCARSRTTSRPGLSKLPAAFRRLGWVTLGTLSHCDVCWALPVSCKERLTLKSLLAWVLLSKRGGGPCFVAVLLGYISSFLAWRVRAALDGWHKGQAFLCKVCPVGMGIHNVKWKEDPFLVLCPFFFFFVLSS